MINSKRRKFLIILFFFLANSAFIKQNLYAKDELIISAIPDQNPEKLNRLYSIFASELSNSLKFNVIYKPVTNYPAAVSAFRNGDLDMVWFGGLTGVQARLQKKGALVIAQRDIDANFHSVFIANTKSNIPLIKNPDDLKLLKGKRFTFGSESSTSGRLMPQYYLHKAGVSTKDFKNKRPGFSGSHDATIALVMSGAYEVGALNEQVWKSHIKKNKTDIDKVKVIWRTPAYVDYHWLVQPDLDKRFGKGFTAKIKNTLLNFNKISKNQKVILDLFGATKFIQASNEQYKIIESIGREIGKIK